MWNHHGHLSLGQAIEKLVEDKPYKLTMISCRGVKVHPLSGFQPDVVDHWCCRFMMRDEGQVFQDANIVCPTPQGLKVLDVWIEGISMSMTQKSEFQGIIQQHGGSNDRFLTFLEQRVQP